ncbi:MAG TPA: hypothetical protein VHK69_17255 [Chitinophagaceae bacterium]|jgi:hypothetical protein|nr:hypothetical protein [Chitinophagaceae bacterium]
MNYYIAVLLGYSILLAGIIGIVRFQKIQSTYYPFLYCIWLAGVNEVISSYLLLTGQYNIINSNIYNLAEALLVLWFFRRLGAFQRYRFLFPFFAGVFTTAWVWENFIYHDFGTAFNSYFNIIYSFPLVLLAINAINTYLIKERNLLKNPAFLICIGIIIFFTYRVLVEAFYVYGLNGSSSFSARVYDILSIINVLCNLIYALAVLWMQKKQVFTLQF